MKEYTPYQQKVIKRYYDQQPSILRDRLAELVGNLYLAEGKKKQQLWASAGEAMKKLEIPEDRIQHILEKADPALLAGIVKELEAK